GKLRKSVLWNGEPTSDGVGHLAAAGLDHSTRNAFDARQQIRRRGLPSGDLEQLLISDDSERRPVELRGHPVAPLDELPQHGELSPREASGAFHAQKGVRPVAVRPARALEEREFLPRPSEPAGTLELALQTVPKLE